MFAFLLVLLVPPCLSWKAMVSDQFYDNVKLKTTLPPLTKLVSSDVSPIVCAVMCSQRSDCRAVNWYPASNGTNVCELLQDNLCSNLLTSVAFQAQSRVWDQVEYSKRTSCILSIRENVPVNCTGMNTTVCDHCTRSCADCWQRYHNMSSQAKKYSCNFWPEGIVGSSVTTWCYNRNAYLVMRKYLNFSVPDPDYFQTMTPFDMHRIVNTGSYKVIGFTVTITNGTPNKSSAYYKLEGEGIDSLGRLSITFLPANSTSSSDAFNTGGQSLINIPFINDSNVLPACGPFWLLPQGNSTCPGGNVRFLGSPVSLPNGTMVDIGVHWPPAGNPADFNQATFSLI